MVQRSQWTVSTMRLPRLASLAAPGSFLSLAFLLLLPPRTTAAAAARTLSVVAVDAEPRDAARPDQESLRRMADAAAANPGARDLRLALVRALVTAARLDDALAAAKAWRARDAYNLVAVRALGDVYMERGQREEAERVYSAIVELVPGEADAQRALATLLKARGDLPAARERLEAAVAGRPGDARLAFELADVELRLGSQDAATGRLESLVAAEGTPEQIRYPAKLRLAQALSEARRRAEKGGDRDGAEALAKKLASLEIKGGLENDVHVYLTWDTDRTDVDLWVTTPAGEKVFYGHRNGRGGEALYDDVTTGYGPESFTAAHARPGVYTVQVNYFSAGRTEFPEARGEVAVVLDEGRLGEQKVVLPYRLFAERQTVTVARIRVGAGVPARTDVAKEAL